MILDDDFSWDKLINVCYPGGFGGDFFCNLLQMNYDPSHTFLPDKNNMFAWPTNYSDTIKFEFERRFLKKTNEVFNCYDKKNVFFGNEVNATNIKSFVNILYDEDRAIFIKNYIQFVRNCYYRGYVQEKHISNFHYTMPIKNFSIHKVFPSSFNIFLYSKNTEYSVLFYLLLFFKLASDSQKTNLSIPFNIKKNGKKIIGKKETILFYKRGYSNCDNMIGIDVGKLFFEYDGYENEAEQILSDALNRKIVLDKNVLNEYKKNNIKLIQRYAGIKNILDICPKEISNKILNNYIEICDDEEWKNLLCL